MNLARLQEAIGEHFHDRECLVYGERRITWAEFTERSRRLAALFRRHGLGAHKERAQLENWESGQDHIALYLHNCNEYMEGLLGAYKCRAVPFNVNYRYREEELLYLLQNAQTKAIVYHARFAPMLNSIRKQLPEIKLWLQVEDDSGQPLMAGARDYESALLASPAQPMDEAASGDDLFMIYTGGTTGMPKGVLWRQQDIFHALIASYLPDGITQEQVVERAVSRKDRAKTGMALPPFMHASGCCIAMGVWFMGNTLLIQSTTERFDADEVVAEMAEEHVSSIAIVGDAFAEPLLAVLDKGEYDLSSLRLISSGGAMLSEHNKRRFQAHLPEVIIFDVLGSSETGQQGLNISRDQQVASSVDFEMVDGSAVLDSDLCKKLQAGSDDTGWMAQSGHVALGYFNDPAKTAKTFPVIDGVRYSVPGDRARVNADGGVHLLGRESVTINSGGEKVFAEEVESVIKRIDGVGDAQVFGMPCERFGQQVTALVALYGSEAVSLDLIQGHCRDALANYKIPRQVFEVARIERTPTGKPDYEWAKSVAGQRMLTEV
jgi:fatty-acyl-CoA synthase